MQSNAAEYVKKYDQCQKHASNIHQPSGNLNPITSPWPFVPWVRHCRAIPTGHR